MITHLHRGRPIGKRQPVFCQIGGGGNQAGEINSSMDVLKTDLLSKYNFQYVGVAGHPEGSPDITPKECEQAIREKNEFNQHTDADLYLATQFLFEAKPLFQWEKTIRDQGNKLPIHVGIPGLATIQTLIRHAKQCGVGPSVRFLKKNTPYTKFKPKNKNEKLLKLDPKVKYRILPSDSQRSQRAYEVKVKTKKSLFFVLIKSSDLI